MGLLQRLEMRQGQSLVMTPQLLQAIKLLQLSHLDLVSYVDAELERNPLLETAESGPGNADHGIDGDAFGSEAPAASAAIDIRRGEIEQNPEPSQFENVFQDDVGLRGPESAAGLTLATPAWQSAGSGGSFDGEDFDATANLTNDPTLVEHLCGQLDMATANEVERLIGRNIVDGIDEAGYLGESCASLAERLAVDLVEVERVLLLVQTFSPTGVAARDLAECLAIQLRERDRLDPAMAALLARLDLVARRDVAALKRICGVDDEDLAEMLAELRQQIGRAHV